ncbi:BtrH N-terminal domain-containing protein [Halorarius litoreus]|uniref:BtrH N-terminal domain-containing protein n=1 Tax=Halorarius litoreus TaxID=2962676 RepID=UPI0020CDE098|nr:BtrH N-terminal domain-containing protein [Halorarius litoreus]
MQLDGFHHAAGSHCGSTSLRDLSDYYGWGFSEPECFGLASGLGFTYFELPTSPWRMFVGRPLWLERAFFDHLDIPHTDREGDDWATAWAQVTDRLDNGSPVMLFVDLYYLDYYDTDTHFAPHSLLVVGYDENREAPDGSTGVAYMADSEFDDIQPLALDSLRAAWASKDVIPLQNRWLAVDGTPRPDTEAAVREALTETASYMLDPDGSQRELGFGTAGVPGIRALAADLPDWTDLEDPTWTARFAYQNIERRGTGGGAFRGLYAPFLDTWADSVGLDGFDTRMHDIASEWTATSEVLYAASETDDSDEQRDLLEQASERVADLADTEQAFYEDALDELG